VDELKSTFLIQCKKCGSDDVEIFPIGYCGEIMIACNECDAKLEI
jgi:hypothetical protein